MVIHWSEKYVEFFDITKDGKHYHIRKHRHCGMCDGLVWSIDGDGLMFRDIDDYEGWQAAVHYIKTELSPRDESARVLGGHTL